MCRTKPLATTALIGLLGTAALLTAATSVAAAAVSYPSIHWSAGQNCTSEALYDPTNNVGYFAWGGGTLGISAEAIDTAHRFVYWGIGTSPGSAMQMPYQRAWSVLAARSSSCAHP
jgi:hypothetical protein